MCMVRNAAAGGFVVIILKDFWINYGEAYIQISCDYWCINMGWSPALMDAFGGFSGGLPGKLLANYIYIGERLLSAN